MSCRWRWVPVVIAVSACAPSWPPQTGRFRPLLERDLVGFEQGLATEREWGAAGPWTAVGWAWVDLLSCRAIAPAGDPVTADTEAHMVYTLVRIDQLRYHYLLGRGRAGETPLADWLGSFAQQPDDTGADWVRWPADDESWSDEIVAPMEIASGCPVEATPAAAEIIEAVDELWSVAQSHGEIRGGLAGAVWRAGLFAAELAVTVEDRQRCFDRLSQWRQEHRDLIAPDQLWLLDWFEVARLDPPPDRALVLAARLNDAALPSALRSGVTLARVRAQIRQGDVDAVLRDPPTLPAVGSPLREGIAYYLGFALAARQQLTALMGLAKAVLQQPGASTSFRVELLRLTMSLLAEHSFSPELVELVEELGPRGETTDRVEVLAHLYLRRDDGKQAERTASWLLAHQRDARAHPRYHAIRALAAVQRGDLSAFRQHLREIVKRPENLMAVLPRHRRGAFFAHADSELAAVLRRVLPLSAELNDEPFRQRLLRASVDEVQRFLREARESQVRLDLLELYRIASEQLEASPRGYASRLGEKMQTVVLGATDLPAPFDPPDLNLGYRAVGIGFVGLIPRDFAPVAQWTNSWPEAEDDDA